MTIAKQIEIYKILLRRKERVVKRNGVTICGSYGKNNAGDDAILEAIVSEITSIDPDLRIRVLSRTPKRTRLSYRVDSYYTFNPFMIVKAFLSSKLYINGGGNLIQDITSTRSLLFYLFTIWLGKRTGCSVMMYGCGIGPVSRPLNRKLAARIMNRNVDAISLREPESGEELKRLGVSNPDIILSADPALILDPSPPSEVQSAMLSSGLSPQDRYIAFIPRDWVSYPEKADIIGRAAEYAFEKHNLTPVFIPLERGKDEHAVSLAIKNIKHVKPIVIPTPKTSTLIGILARMEAVVSMRLHGLIFAAGQGVLVGIAYDTKVGSFLSYMEQDSVCHWKMLMKRCYSPNRQSTSKDRTKLASAEGLRALNIKSRNST